MLLVYLWMGLLSAHAATLTPDQHRRAEQMTNYFENSTVNPQYDYIENLKDGRGYTAGRVGFTTATGDLYSLVEKYCKDFSSSLCAYLPTLKLLAASESGDVRSLGKHFVTDWKIEATSLHFMDAQDFATEETYFEPSQIRAENANVRSALGQAIFYDTLVQHGDGDDPDSIGAIIHRTEEHFGVLSGGRKESDWLYAFLEMRRQDLLHPSDPSTQHVWAQSVDRVNFLESQLEKENFDLRGPIEMSPEQPASNSYIP